MIPNHSQTRRDALYWAAATVLARWLQDGKIPPAQYKHAMDYARSACQSKLQIVRPL